MSAQNQFNFCNTMLKLPISEELHKSTLEFMKSEGVKNYEVKIEKSSEKGENYLGEVVFFQVIVKERQKTYNLVMKTANKSSNLRLFLPIASAYKRELYMYGKVFPEMEIFLKNLNHGLIFYVPKIYWTCEKERHETLIMENMNSSGYKVFDRTSLMDLQHSLLLMENIGKFHASSLALRKQKPAIFKLLTNDLSDVWEEFSKTMDVTVFYGRQFTHVLKLLEANGRSDLVMKFKTIEENIENLILYETPEDEKLVICHGDFKNNNILFKYEDDDKTKPTEVCFIDFQLSMLDNPVKDLSYFIYSSCGKAVLDELELLLQTYHNSLSAILRKLGCVPDDIFSYAQLKEQWKKYATRSLIISPHLVKIALMTSEEAPDFSVVLDEGGDLGKNFNVRMKNEDLYNKRMIDIFTHFGETFL